MVLEHPTYLNILGIMHVHFPSRSRVQDGPILGVVPSTQKGFKKIPCPCVGILTTTQLTQLLVKQ